MKLHQCNRATLPGDFVIIIAQGVGRLPSTKIPKNLAISILRIAGIEQCTHGRYTLCTICARRNDTKKIILEKELNTFEVQIPGR